jgi:hypothetical protein
MVLGYEERTGKKLRKESSGEIKKIKKIENV